MSPSSPGLRFGLVDPDEDHPAKADVTFRLGRLRDAGVVICDDPDPWQPTPTR